MAINTVEKQARVWMVLECVRVILTEKITPDKDLKEVSKRVRGCLGKEHSRQGLSGAKSQRQ